MRDGLPDRRPKGLAQRAKRQTHLLDGTVSPSLIYPVLALNRVPFRLEQAERIAH